MFVVDIFDHLSVIQGIFTSKVSVQRSIEIVKLFEIELSEIVETSSISFKRQSSCNSPTCVVFQNASSIYEEFIFL